MRQKIAKDFVLKDTKHPFVFENPDGHFFTITFIDSQIVRVRYLTPNDVEYPINHNNFSNITTTQQQDSISFETKDIRLVVTLYPDFHVSYFAQGSDTPFSQDLAYRAYGYNDETNQKWHYQTKQSYYYGLGERTGKLNLCNRRFRLDRFDCMGYDAESTDPLYKFCPFYISLSNQAAFGIYYNNFSNSVIDLGQEIDAIWGRYVYYQCDSGPIDYYLIYGPSVQSIIQNYSKITGRPRYLPPRYSLGYLASSMGYAESENAQQDILNFVDKCIENNIPCDGIHLSSGYTVNDKGDRCVFTWNKHRFPDPERLAADLQKKGIKIFANIKPWLLYQSHPDYDLVRNQKGFVWDKSQPGMVMQWRGGRNTRGNASYIDFTSQAGYTYWKSRVKSELLDKGYFLWLDNNEFSIPDDSFTFACQVSTHLYANLKTMGPFVPEHQETSLKQVGTCLQTLLMAQASYEALLETQAIQRPFLITRSATPFLNELVSQTWSGDNTTAWQTIQYNVSMGLGASLSNMPAGYGHDIGGFAGPKPDPDMFVRWVQQSVFWPRFSIHSWNSDDSVTEPWMYPEVASIIQSSIHFRYKLIPYIYTLYALYAFRQGEPLIRPVFYHHQDDENTYDQGFEFMLGPWLLVAPIYEPNVTTRRVYLPKKSQWYHYQTGDYYDIDQGKYVEVSAPFESETAPFFVKAGSMMCFGKAQQTSCVDDERRIEIFPDKYNTKKTFILYEDDGNTIYHKGEAYAEIHVWMETTDTEIYVGLDIVHDGFFPYYDIIWVTCPLVNEKRKLVFVEGMATSKLKVVQQECNIDLKLSILKT